MGDRFGQPPRPRYDRCVTTQESYLRGTASPYVPPIALTAMTRFDKRFYTTAEAAEYLGAAGPSTVRSWIARDELVPDGRSGRNGTYLFFRNTLDEFAERCVGSGVSR